MILERFPEILELTPEEQHVLATELWQRLDNSPVKLSPEWEAELDRRMQEYEEHPERCVTWEQVKANLKGLRNA